MKKKILVAGGTGDLGERIIKALVKKDVDVIAIVREEADEAKVARLEEAGAIVMRVDMNNINELTTACTDVTCVVSALAGLKDVIVDLQSLLLDAAIAAGVPRFIPSDYSVNFSLIPDGENRNFDLRKEFHKKLDAASIEYTSIFLGAFADILFYNTPFYDTEHNTIGYWGDKADWKVDFTTKDNAAAYIAAVALDDDAPQKLRIASFQISANDLLKKAGDQFTLQPMGSLEELSAYNKKQRAANPESENELYPAWQQSQYMHSMFLAHNEKLDNDRYKVKWTGIDEVLGKRK